MVENANLSFEAFRCPVVDLGRTVHAEEDMDSPLTMLLQLTLSLCPFTIREAVGN